MTVIPKMPDDWWPERVILIGDATALDGRKLKVSLMLLEEDMREPELWKLTVEEMRRGLWTAKHAEPAE